MQNINNIASVALGVKGALVQGWHQMADYHHPTYRGRQGRRFDHRSDIAEMRDADNRFLNQYARSEDGGSVLGWRGLLAELGAG